MGWTKDDSSESPKVIYTPTHAAGVTRLVYDPNADAGRRLICEMSYLHIPDSETLEDIDASLGVS